MTGWYYADTTTASSTSFNFAGTTQFYIRMGPPAPPAPPPIAQTLLHAVALFGLTVPIADWGVVQKRYRVLARENHPDAGGDPERMKQINAAYDLLKSVRPQ